MRSTTRSGTDPLTDLCRAVFEGMRRTDQRHWAEVYVRGLVTVRGRKTPARIGAAVSGSGTEQSLQQFVNQSPWDWSPARRRLARMLDAALPAEAWLLGDVAMPKNGRQSVGVDRQFVHQEGRAVNCQLAVVANLVGRDEVCPVDWRLRLPSSWAGDRRRRVLAHVPDEVAPRSRSQHHLDLVDELRAGFDLTPRPVLADARPERDPGGLLDGLEARSLRYLVEVDPAAPLAGLTAPIVTGTVAEHATALVRARRHVRVVPATVPVPRAATVLQLPLPTGDELATTVVALRPRRHLLVAWLPSIGVRRAWVSNLPPAALATSPWLLGVADRGRATTERLRDDAGLFDFEGRSYRGWHHHTTLSSVAHAYSTLHSATEPAPVPVRDA